MSLEKALDPAICVVERSRDFPSAGGVRVYYVCEAFGNSQAARIAGQVIRNLLRAGAGCVCVEAAFDRIDAADLDARLLTLNARHVDPADALERGEVDLLQYLTLTEGGFDVHGVEERALYAATIQLAQELARERAAWTARLGSVIEMLRVDPNHVLSPRYADLMSQVAAEGDEDGTLRIEVLMDYALTMGLKSRTRNIRLLQDTRRIEALIDFDEANHELSRLVDLLVQRTSSREQVLTEALRATAPIADGASMYHTSVARLLHFGIRRRPELAAHLADPAGALLVFEQSLDLAMTALSRTLRAEQPITTLVPPAFAELIEVMLVLGIRLGDFPNLVRYVHYANRVRRIDMTQTVAEIRNLTEQVARQLATTPEDHRHASLVTDLIHVKRVMGLACTTDDLKWVRNRESALGFSALAGEVSAFLHGLGTLHAFATLEAAYTGRFEHVLDYYDRMTSRANAMAMNTWSYLRQSGRRETVLVTGGFHRGTIMSNFDRLQLPCTVITPRFNHESTEDEIARYFNKLSAQTHVG